MSSPDASPAAAAASTRGSPNGSPRSKQDGDAADLRRSPRIQSKPHVRYVTRTQKATQRSERKANRMIQSLFDDDNAEDDTDSHAEGSEDRDETANDEASDTSEDEASESSRLVQTKYLERKSKRADDDK
ncbi:hypothetical protein P43SY_004313 [Pythium insidiosum]|uniref:Uncharacterized protein n=1 Tax=Pythium insidiosum TaxID=114742 RepID=A0AAD5MDR7_PYTIN|nr:hypothetical protein P43SY_004313 [Pythium insidiosum]